MGQKSSVEEKRETEEEKKEKQLTIIDVRNLDKTELLKQLLLALPRRWVKIHWMDLIGGRNEEKDYIHWDRQAATEELEPALKYEEIDHDSAEAAVANGFIQKFGDRDVNVNLLGNLVDATEYDKIAGEGTFARVVQQMKLK